MKLIYLHHFSSAFEKKNNENRFSPKIFTNLTFVIT